MITRRSALTGMAALTAGSLFAGVSHSRSLASGYRLELRTLDVLRQGDRQGDRPYLVTIALKSRLRQRRSTEVRLVEAEPHDWVTRPAYNAGIDGRRFMRAGDRLAIPWWMGNSELYGIDRVEDPTGRAWIFGALILGLQDRGAGPGVVRAVMARAARGIRAVLIDQVETGAIRTMHAREQPLQGTLPGLASRLVDALGAQLADPQLAPADRLAGAHVLLWSALKSPAGGADGWRELGGERVRWRASWAPPPAGIAPFAFELEGAATRYQVKGTIRELASRRASVDRLELQIKTGSRALQPLSTVHATLLGPGSKRVVLANVTGSRGLAPYSDVKLIRALPGGWSASDVRGLELDFTPSGNSDWELLGVSVGLHGAANLVAHPLIQTGAPLHRFTPTARHLAIVQR